MATIVDPAVREDGRGDPQLLLAADERAPAAPPAPGEPHPVRERLLARARSALTANATLDEARTEGEPSAPGDAWFEKETRSADAAIPTHAPGLDAGLEPSSEPADDLDLIGAPERARPERTRQVAPALTAPTALLLGSLAGLASIAALFALLIQFDRHEPLNTPAPPRVEAPTPAPEEPAPPPIRTVQRPPRAKVPGPWRISDAAHDPLLLTLRASMGKRTFLAATQLAGISLKDSYRILGAFEGIKNLDRCRAKDSFTALVDARTRRLTAFEYTAGEEDVFQAREGADGKLAARRLDLDVKRHRAQGVVMVDGSFEDSSRRAGFEPGLGEFVNKALSGYVSTADMHAGDVLGLVVQEVTVLGDFSRYAGVEAVEYRPVSGEPLRIYYQEHDKSRGYVDAKGRVFGKSRWTRPVPGAGVTSRYNPKRMHPILKRIKPHNGTDFGSPIGTPVVAASAGTVAFVGRAGPNGNMVTVAHDGGYQTGYSHLSRFAKGLKAGARVEQRQTLGYVGSTGRSTGPHLHFSAKKNGRFIDPETLNLDGLLRLTVDQRLSSDLRRRYDRMLDAMRLPEAHAPIPLSARANSSVAPDPGASLTVEIASARAAPPRPPAASVAAASVPGGPASAAANATPAGASAATSSTLASPAANPEAPASLPSAPAAASEAASPAASSSGPTPPSQPTNPLAR